MKLKATLLVCCAFVLTFSTFAQDVPDVVWKSPMSKVYTTGEYVNLPISQEQVNYKNPNTTTRVINENGMYLVLPPNVRPFPHTATQSEVDAANMFGNSQIVFASWNSYGPSFWGTGYATSTNGGTSWTGNFQMFTPNSGDPAPWVWPAGSTWAGRYGMSVISHAAYSTNNGTSWSAPVAFNPGGGSAFDKNFSAVDNFSTSPFFGRAYTVWTDFTGSSGWRIRISYTTDGGVSWSASTFVSPTASSGHHHQGCDVKVGSNGNVHVIWANCTTNGQNSTEDSLGYARSTDGGVTWTVAKNNAIDMNGIRTQNLFGLPNTNQWVRASGFPRLAIDTYGGPRNGWIYSLAAEKTLAPAGDASDIILCRSADNGNTWTRIKVNQDPSNGRFNYMPAVTVTPDGAVNVVYYDQRNTTGIVTQVYLSRSNDGGNTWTDVQVSDHNFSPAPISGLATGYQGDYIGMTHANGKLWPFWADNSSGIYQVWTDGITYGPPPANDVIVGPFLSFPSQFIANSNYTIRGKVTNAGTNAQTNLPIRFSVNGVIQTTNTIPNLPASGVDSSSFSWTPTAQGNYTLRFFSGAAVDENRLNDTIMQVVQVLPQGTSISNSTFCRNGLNKAILDNQTTYDTITVNIANAFNVIDVNVRVDTIVHTYDGDLTLTINHLANSSSLSAARGSSGDNFINTIFNDSAANSISTGTAPFTGSYRPETPLSSFNNNPVNGTWILSVADNATADTGFLRAWCIVVTYQSLIGGIHTVEIPNYYSLSQNYPNPFNPTTNIKYTIPKAGITTLKIFDVLGREVAVLVNELKQPGVYTADFDASQLASGIYFYRIESGDFSAVKKMMLVK